MTYIVKDECINVNSQIVLRFVLWIAFMREKILAINPDECIDCGVCEPECPIDAIKADTDESVKDMDKWLLINKKFLNHGLIFQKSRNR